MFGLNLLECCDLDKNNYDIIFNLDVLGGYP